MRRSNQFYKKGIILLVVLIIIVGIAILCLNLGMTPNFSQAISQEKNSNEELKEEKRILAIPKNIEDKNYHMEVILSPAVNLQAKNDEEENVLFTVKKEKHSNGKTYDTIAYLSIPSLNINYSVLSSTSDELLKISLNKFWGPNPNEIGNFCIVGHNYEDSRFFGKLSQIKKGAIIKITDMSGRTIDYEAYKTEIIDPYDTKCTSQLTDGKREITLITCHYGGSHRFTVKAREV